MDDSGTRERIAGEYTTELLVTEIPVPVPSAEPVPPRFLGVPIHHLKHLKLESDDEVVGKANDEALTLHARMDCLNEPVV